MAKKPRPSFPVQFVPPFILPRTIGTPWLRRQPNTSFGDGGGPLGDGGGSLGSFNQGPGDVRGGGDWPLGPDSGGPGGGGGGPLGDGGGSLGLDWQLQQGLPVALGYHADLPDHRDFDVARVRARLAAEHNEALERSFLFNHRDPATDAKPVDLRARRRLGAHWPVESQGPLHACTAHAVIGLVEYLVGQGCNESMDLSRLFLYRVTRRLTGFTGDSGAYLRSTIKALGIFGTPPEVYWPYDLRRFDSEPDAFLYSFASRFTALLYARLDEYGFSGDDTLKAVRRALADGFPVAFGFPVYDSLTTSPDIPFPNRDRDTLIGGHAVLAIGYDDNRTVAGDQEKGALIVRNSWGPRWGNQGYGYLPYSYVRRQLACDFWTIFRQSWLSKSQFGEVRGTQ